MTGATNAELARQRVKLPATWDAVPSNYHGALRLARRFGCPSGLEPRNRVFLVIDACHPLSGVSLRGVPLGPSPAAPGVVRYDITALLHQNNQLEVELERTLGGGGHGESQQILGEVWLEITTDD